MSNKIKCIIHGSFRKHFDEIMKAHEIFSKADIEVLAPSMSKVMGITNGFVKLASDKSLDPRMVELYYLNNINKLGSTGFSYYINPENILGPSAAYELGIDQFAGVQYLFSHNLKDPQIYVPKNSVWSPENLADYILKNGYYPLPIIPKNEENIPGLVQNLVSSYSKPTVGAILVDGSKEYKKGEARRILIIKTGTWGEDFTIVGGGVKAGNISYSLEKEIWKQTGLCASIDSRPLHVFPEPNGRRIFIDHVAYVSGEVKLNENAKGFEWISPDALETHSSEIESNALKTIRAYAQNPLRGN